MRQARRALLEDEDTFATVLHAIAMEAYGEEYLEWEEETILMELQEDFGATLPEGQPQKLWALMAALGDDSSFYADAESFEVTCEALSGSFTGYSDFPSEDVLPGELAWGVVEVMLNNPDKTSFSEDVAAYTGVQLRSNGIQTPFQPLGFAIMGDVESMESIDLNIGSNNAAVAVRFVGEQMFALVDQIQRIPEFAGLLSAIQGILETGNFQTSADLE